MSGSVRTGIVLLLGAALWSAGCLSGAPRDHFFRLEAPPPQLRFDAPVFAGVLEVDALRADPLVRGRPILRSPAPDSVELVPHRYHLWVDSPTLSVQQSLVQDLRARGIAERVVTPEMRAEEDWVVVGRIARLEHHGAEAGGGVRVELELGLAAADGRVLFLDRYRDEQAVGSTVEAAAKAMGEALGRIFERFAADLAAAAENG